jgi:transcription elongation factor Elf1
MHKKTQKINIKEKKVSKITRKKTEVKYKCQACGKKEKVYRMFDIDGTNLVEVLVCLNCGSGRPEIQF